MRPVLAAVVGLFATLAVNVQSANTIDAAFAKFWSARSPGDAAKAAADIVRTGVAFDDAYGRLKRGRTYDKHPPTGVMAGHRGEFSYFLDVPPAYDPARVYQVRIQLHGGISAPRDTNQRAMATPASAVSPAPSRSTCCRPRGTTRRGGATRRSTTCARILDTVKRTYNVDENRVVVVGRFRRRNGRLLRRRCATRRPTPLPAAERLHPGAAAHGVNDGRAVSRQPAQQAVLRRQRRARSALSHGRGRADARALVQRRRDDYVRPQPQAGARHDVVAGGEGRVRGVRPRASAHALPRNADVGNGGPHRFGRAHWLQIDAIGQTPDESRDLRT